MKKAEHGKVSWIFAKSCFSQINVWPTVHARIRRFWCKSTCAGRIFKWAQTTVIMCLRRSGGRRGRGEVIFVAPVYPWCPLAHLFANIFFVESESTLVSTSNVRPFRVLQGREGASVTLSCWGARDPTGGGVVVVDRLVTPTTSLLHTRHGYSFFLHHLTSTIWQNNTRRRSASDQA